MLVKQNRMAVANQAGRQTDGRAATISNGVFIMAFGTIIRNQQMHSDQPHQLHRHAHPHHIADDEVGKETHRMPEINEMR